MVEAIKQEYWNRMENLGLHVDKSRRNKYTGYYNGYNVEIRSLEQTALLYNMGCFGKGSASRSKPKAAQKDVTPRIMRKRQYLQRNDWFKNFEGNREIDESDSFLNDIGALTTKIISDSKKRTNKKRPFVGPKKDVIDLVSSDEDDAEETKPIIHSDRLRSQNKDDIVVIIPDSESEEENYFADMKPKCCLNKVKIQEKLMLTLQEAFFLLYSLGCLQIVNLDNTFLSVEKCWDLFTTTDKKFASEYIVYHYYRSKGYVVKPGIKFGGDYLLYKGGPGVSHADFIVVIKYEHKNYDWVSILGHVRMANTTVKEILMVEVIKPCESDVNLLENLKLYKIRELLLSRKLPDTLEEEPTTSGPWIELTGNHGATPLPSSGMMQASSIKEEPTTSGTRIKSTGIHGETPLPSSGMMQASSIKEEPTTSGTRIESTGIHGERPLPSTGMTQANSIKEEPITSGTWIKPTGSHDERPLPSTGMTQANSIKEEPSTSGTWTKPTGSHDERPLPSTGMTQANSIKEEPSTSGTWIKPTGSHEETRLPSSDEDE